MNFGKDFAKERETLLAQFRECLDDDEGLEIQRQIIQLNREEKQAKEERENKVKNLLSSLQENKIGFDELMASKVYSPKVVLEYLEQHRLIPSQVSSSKETKEGEEGDNKKALIVGTFKLADYGFEAPNSNETEFTWQWSKRYGPSWQSKFIRTIAEKGYEQVLEKATPEFKAWLMEYREGEKRAKDKKIYENKRDFMKTFGIKPAEADKIELNLEVPGETFTRMADDHALADQQDSQTGKKKSKKATA